jgi:hypothetical protein
MEPITKVLQQLLAEIFGECQQEKERALLEESERRAPSR